MPRDRYQRRQEVAWETAARYHDQEPAARETAARPGRCSRRCQGSAHPLTAIRSRHIAARPIQVGGRDASTPSAASRPASTSAGSAGNWPGVWACRSTKSRRSENSAATICPTCTANAVLPTPGMPLIAWMATTRPAAAAVIAASLIRSSCSVRPVNEAASAGRVLTTRARGCSAGFTPYRPSRRPPKRRVS